MRPRNFNDQFDKDQRTFNWIFRGVFCFIIVIFVAIITFYVMVGKYVVSGKAKQDLNSEVSDITKIIKSRD